MLIVGGISGAGMTATLEAYRPIFLVVTFGLLGVAFYLTYRPRPATSSTGTSRTMIVNKIMVWTATVFAIVFLFFPQYLTGPVAADDAGFTSDMLRSVVVVEGMTCPG